MRMSPAQHFFYWLVPIAVALGFFSTYFLGEEVYTTFFFQWLFPNTSVLEIVTGLPQLAAILFGLYILRRQVVWSDKSMRTWLIIFVIAVFYFMGEDHNWGQYYFDLQPSEYLLTHNKEKEINLHNMSTWFNQKPRLMVELWVIIACIIVPLGWKWPVKATSKFVPSVFWPTAKVVPLAIAAELTTLPERLRKLEILADSGWLHIRFSEIQEWLYSYIMLLFLVELWRRLELGKRA